ncbi:MAG TPA: hypothetical protein VEK08_17220 [Planctomycetota bacterium]|nr:hypothetical protein [Planctomycetota bacterium]
MTTTAKTTAILALLLGTSLTATKASAADFGFSINFGRPVVEHCPPPRPVVVRPVTVREWVPERREVREEQVLVEPARCEKVWVPEVVEMRHDRRGRPYEVVIQEGYYKDVHVPARYETRCVTVVVPGYYRDVAVATCEPYRGGYGYRTGHVEYREHDRHDFGSDRRDFGNDRRDIGNGRRDFDSKRNETPNGLNRYEKSIDKKSEKSVLAKASIKK